MTSKLQSHQLDLAISAFQIQVFRLQLSLILEKNEIYPEKTEEEKEALYNSIQKIQQVVNICRTVATPFDGAVALSQIQGSRTPWVL